MKIIENPKFPKITKIESSMKNGNVNFGVSILKRGNPQLQLKNTKSSISDFLLDALKQMHGIKLNICSDITFMKQDGKDQYAFFKTKAKEITNKNDTVDVISDSNYNFLNRISDWISKDSGWIIISVDKRELNVIKYDLLRGSSYLHCLIKLKIKKRLINIKNDKDNECLRWCHLAYLFPVKGHHT